MGTDGWQNRLWSIFNAVRVRGRNAIRVIQENETQFGENLVAARTPIIELNSSYGQSLLRDASTVTGSGTVTDGTGVIVVATGATASSTAKLESAESGRYAPGYVAQLGIGIRLRQDSVTGGQVARWGGLDAAEENGIYFGRDASSLFVARLNGGVEVEHVNQSDFNIDKLDGTGQSGFNLDANDGQIYQIEFSWYGYGQILFGVIGILPESTASDRDRTAYEPQQHFIPCHSMRPIGGISLATPNLKIFADAKNNATAANLALDVGGRQYSIIGDFRPRFRVTGEWNKVSGIGTTVVPIITFQRKSGFSDRSIIVQDFDLIAAGENLIIYVILNGTLTGASFGTPREVDADETAVEVDIAATAIAGGTAIYTTLIEGGGGNKSGGVSGAKAQIDIPGDLPVTLAARTTSGTNADLSAVFRIQEEW